MCKILLSNKGFTLVEIIVSLTIFSIMAVAFLNLFFGSFLISQRAEVRTSTVAEAAGAVENKISTGVTGVTPSSVDIIYSSGITSEAIGVKMVETQTNSEGQTITINYFIPEEL